MTRSPVRVRDAEEQDADALLCLWLELRDSCEAGEHLFTQPSRRAVVELLARLADDAHHRLVVAEVDGEVAGCCLLSRDPLGPLAGADAVRVSYLTVGAVHRRRGVARRLVAAAASYAESLAAGHVVVELNAASRDTQRYFARLGFSPLLTRRVASVETLRRTFGAVHRDPVTTTGHLAARRRSLRLRTRPRAAKVS